MKYRKRPVVIEAVQVRDALHSAMCEWSALPAWLAEAYMRGDVFFLNDSITIQTLEGDMVGGVDDWIIRGIKGELYPCKPDVFEATYDPVPDDYKPV